MTLYEETLSKISPIFYKLVQYEKYYDRNVGNVVSYVYNLRFPYILNLYFLTKKIYYFYDSTEISPYYYFSIKALNITLIKLGIEHVNKPVRYFAYPTIIIINMVLNNFSFESERLFIRDQTSPKGLTNYYTVKDLFIALVGRDTYDTIRRNIK